jgi:hypothetical protein
LRICSQHYYKLATLPYANAINIGERLRIGKV